MIPLRVWPYTLPSSKRVGRRGRTRGWCVRAPECDVVSCPNHQHAHSVPTLFRSQTCQRSPVCESRLLTASFSGLPSANCASTGPRETQTQMPPTERRGSRPRAKSVTVDWRGSIPVPSTLQSPAHRQGRPGSHRSCQPRIRPGTHIPLSPTGSPHCQPLDQPSPFPQHPTFSSGRVLSPTLPKTTQGPARLSLRFALRFVPGPHSVS